MAHELESSSEINERVDRLLRAANAYGRFPTPVEDIIAQADLVEAMDYVLDESLIKKAPAYLRGLLRSAAKKIQGLVDRRARVIHISPEIENEGKKRFVKLHETVHHILPHQQDLLYADDHETLALSTTRLFEREANQGAAELLFQRDRFARDAGDLEISTATVCLLADRYGSSIHSSLRRYAETHDAAVAAIVLERTARSMSPPTWRREEFMCTERWVSRFGAPAWPKIMQTDHFPFLAVLDHAELDTIVIPKRRRRSYRNSSRHAANAVQELRPPVGARQATASGAATGHGRRHPAVALTSCRDLLGVGRQSREDVVAAPWMQEPALLIREMALSPPPDQPATYPKA